MDTCLGERDRAGREGTGEKRKGRFKQLRSRLFGRLRRKDAWGGTFKQSQSVGDVASTSPTTTAAYSFNDEQMGYRVLCARTLSHDSIFQPDQYLGPADCPAARALSQEHLDGGRIHALQLKLQEQNMRLGPPPLRLPTARRMEDSGAASEDDGLPRSPADPGLRDRANHEQIYEFPGSFRTPSILTLAGTGSEEEDQWSCNLPSSPSEPATSGVDLSSPPRYTPSLDTSAARHRLSVKPRNQRASKAHRHYQGTSRPSSETLSEEETGLEQEDRCQVDDDPPFSPTTMTQRLSFQTPSPDPQTQAPSVGVELPWSGEERQVEVTDGASAEGPPPPDAGGGMPSRRGGGGGEEREGPATETSAFGVKLRPASLRHRSTLEGVAPPREEVIDARREKVRTEVSPNRVVRNSPRNPPSDDFAQRESANKRSSTQNGAEHLPSLATAPDYCPSTGGDDTGRVPHQLQPSSPSSSSPLYIAASPAITAHGDQPLWMELAHKKSKAWSQKSQD